MRLWAGCVIPATKSRGDTESSEWRGSSGVFFFFQAEGGIRDLVRSRGLGDVYKRQEKGIKLKTYDSQNMIPSLKLENPKLNLVYSNLNLSLIHI